MLLLGGRRTASPIPGWQPAPPLATKAPAGQMRPDPANHELHGVRLGRQLAVSFTVGSRRRRRSTGRLLLRQVLDAAEDVIPDDGRYFFLISPPERFDELRMLPNGFLVRPTGLGPVRK